MPSNHDPFKNHPEIEKSIQRERDAHNQKMEMFAVNAVREQQRKDAEQRSRQKMQQDNLNMPTKPKSGSFGYWAIAGFLAILYWGNEQNKPIEKTPEPTPVTKVVPPHHTAKTTPQTGHTLKPDAPKANVIQAAPTIHLTVLRTTFNCNDTQTGPKLSHTTIFTNSQTRTDYIVHQTSSGRSVNLTQLGNESRNCHEALTKLNNIGMLRYP